MSYSKQLLQKAAASAGSRYALSKITGIPQSHMSDVMNGKREVPASWVLKLARVAEVDPTEAMEMHDLERSEKKRLRQLLSRSAAGGVVAMLLVFASSNGTVPIAENDRMSHQDRVDDVIIVSV